MISRTQLIDRLRKRAFAVHLLSVGLMIVTSPAMVLAIRHDSDAGFWAALGAFIFANLLECLIP